MLTQNNAISFKIEHSQKIGIVPESDRSLWIVEQNNKRSGQIYQSATGQIYQSATGQIYQSATGQIWIGRAESLLRNFSAMNATDLMLKPNIYLLPCHKTGFVKSQAEFIYLRLLIAIFNSIYLPNK